MSSIKEIVIDTNFFMIPFQFNVDVIAELKKIAPSYKLTTTNFVIDELVGLSSNKNSTNRNLAKLALKLAKSSNIFKLDESLKMNESVDDALIRLSKILATNDKGLKKRARDNGVTVIYLRQKRYLAIDGHI